MFFSQFAFTHLMQEHHSCLVVCVVFDETLESGVKLLCRVNSLISCGFLKWDPIDDVIATRRLNVIIVGLHRMTVV